MNNKTKITILTFIALIAINVKSVVAQDKGRNLSDWKELITFHEVISQTFHPSEEGDLKPIRERSNELHEKAILLQTSKIPTAFNSPDVMTAARELNEKTKQLDDLIKKNGGDEEVKSLLTSVHDSFHKIIGLCKGGDHDEKDEHKKEEHKSEEKAK